MPTTVEGIQADIDEAATPGFRGRLIARGQARVMIWRDGVLPPDAPAFTPQLSYDLHSYGYSVLGLGLRLREMDGDPTRARIVFEQAGTALEAVMAKGDRGDSDRDFHFVMAAAYHLARYSARAYSLLAIVQAEDNFSPVERALAPDVVAAWSAIPDWPTAKTHDMWSNFLHTFTPREASTWSDRRYWSWVAWRPGEALPAGTPVRLFQLDGQPAILSPDGRPIGVLQAPLNPNRRGLVRASVMAEAGKVSLSYLGPDDLWLA